MFEQGMEGEWEILDLLENKMDYFILCMYTYNNKKSGITLIRQLLIDVVELSLEWLCL